MMILRVSHFKAQSSYEALLSSMNSLLFLYYSHCILPNILALPQLWDLVLSFSSISVQFWLQLKGDFLQLEYSRPKWIDSVVWADALTVHHLSLWLTQCHLYNKIQMLVSIQGTF